MNGSFTNFHGALVAWKMLQLIRTNIDHAASSLEFIGGFALVLAQASEQQILLRAEDDEQALRTLFWLVLTWVDAGRSIDVIVWTSDSGNVASIRDE